MRPVAFGNLSDAETSKIVEYPLWHKDFRIRLIDTPSSNPAAVLAYAKSKMIQYSNEEAKIKG